VLTHQVDDAPAAVALLDVRERERRHFRASKTAAQGWQSSRVESVHLVVTNTTPGWTDLIRFLRAALALWLAAETLFRRRK
jgi:hypothetical protein